MDNKKIMIMDRYFKLRATGLQHMEAKNQAEKYANTIYGNIK